MAMHRGLDPVAIFQIMRGITHATWDVEALHFGPAHTETDVIAYVPDANLIFTGDLLESAGPPVFGPDTHLKDWPSAVDGILGLVDEHTVLVPGHGPVMDRMAGFQQRAEISGLYGQAEYLVSKAWGSTSRTSVVNGPSTRPRSAGCCHWPTQNWQPSGSSPGPNCRSCDPAG